MGQNTFKTSLRVFANPIGSTNLPVSSSYCPMFTIIPFCADQFGVDFPAFSFPQIVAKHPHNPLRKLLSPIQRTIFFSIFHLFHVYFTNHHTTPWENFSLLFNAQAFFLFFIFFMYVLQTIAILFSRHCRDKLPSPSYTQIEAFFFPEGTLIQQLESYWEILVSVVCKNGGVLYDVLEIY